MPGDDALTVAVAELYALDPAEFTRRRTVLATRARQNGDAHGARSIAALRRPTQAAAILNRLARTEPDVVAGLANLAAELREAQRALDGARLRELTLRRRALIEAATRSAVGLSAQPGPPQSLRQEISSTLEAALADPTVAEQFGAGTLVRSAQWSGFGDSAPTLTAVPDRSAPSRPAPDKRTAAKRAAPDRPGAAPDTATITKQATATRDDTQERRRHRLAHAEDALAAAGDELQAATTNEQERGDRVRQLTEQLADASRRLDEARLRTRQAAAQHRDAQRRRERAQG